MAHRPIRSSYRPSHGSNHGPSHGSSHGATRGSFRGRFAGFAAAVALAASGLGAQAPRGAAWAEEDTVFLAGVADLPLMPGLAEVLEAGLVFDKPSGRIVEAYAEGAVSRAAVSSFYLGTLPNLGWRSKAEFLFQRDGELLRLGFTGDDGALVVRFTLQPE